MMEIIGGKYTIRGGRLYMDGCTVMHDILSPDDCEMPHVEYLFYILKRGLSVDWDLGGHVVQNCTFLYELPDLENK